MTTQKNPKKLKGIKDYQKAKRLLKELIEKSHIAIEAIDENRPNWEICTLAEEDITNLTEQISKAVLGDYSLAIKEYLNVQKDVIVRD